MAKPMRIPEGKIVLTYDDYVELPDDGKRYEVLEGELSVTPAPNPKHQAASGNLFFLMTRHIKANNLGKLFHAPIDLILESASVLQPDLVFIAKHREDIITDRAIEGAPDLVVEILSPSTNRSDRVTKAHLYARHHIPVYWIADPELEALEIYQLDNNSYRLLTTLQDDSPQEVPPFTGLSLSVKDIFG